MFIYFKVPKKLNVTKKHENCLATDRTNRCRRCKTHTGTLMRLQLPAISGYCEVPPIARRYLSKPSIRMECERLPPGRQSDEK